MPATRHVALLRGINVGGRNKVAMADLRAAVEHGGYDDVRTYIQSGNVLLSTTGRSGTLEADLEALLAERLGMPVLVITRSHRRLRAIVDGAPDGFGIDPDRFHFDVIFLKRPLTSAQVMRVIEQRDGVDRAWAGTGVVYFSRLSERLSQSRMNRIVGTPAYQQMTIRNWNTTTKLLELMDAPSPR